MKIVIDNLLRRPRHMAQRRIAVRFPHVHSHRFNAGALLRRQRPPEPVKALLLPVVLNRQNPDLVSPSALLTIVTYRCPQPTAFSSMHRRFNVRCEAR
jgi:hypothetical protein